MHNINLVKETDEGLTSIATLTTDYIPSPGDTIMFVRYNEMEEGDEIYGEYEVVRRIFYVRPGELVEVEGKLVPALEPYKYQYESIRFIVEDLDERRKKISEEAQEASENFELLKNNTLEYFQKRAKELIPNLILFLKGLAARIGVWIFDTHLLGRTLFGEGDNSRLPKRIKDLLE